MVLTDLFYAEKELTLNPKKHEFRREPPKRSVLEEVGNAVTHGVGALFAVAALVLMVSRYRPETLCRAGLWHLSDDDVPDELSVSQFQMGNPREAALAPL